MKTVFRIYIENRQDAEKVTGAYQRIEEGVVGAYKKVENAFVDRFFRES